MKNESTLLELKTATLKAHADGLARDAVKLSALKASDAKLSTHDAILRARRAKKAEAMLKEGAKETYGDRVFKVYASRAAEFGIDTSGMKKAAGTFEDSGLTLEGHKVMIYWPEPGNKDAHIHFGTI